MPNYKTMTSRIFKPNKSIAKNENIYYDYSKEKLRSKSFIYSNNNVPIFKKYKSRY